MTLIEFIYDELRSRDAVRTAREYSLEFLKKSVTYFAEHRRHPSLTTLRDLHGALRDRGHPDLAARVAHELLGDALEDADARRA